MNFIYHRVPQNMRGDVLFPLNVLKEKYPEVYDQAAAKYAGREHVLQRKIPFLDCLWNDVIHFSPVHPSEIKKALAEAGSDRIFEFFQVDAEALPPENTLVYLHHGWEEKDFISFDPEELRQFSHMPETTKEYYREMISENKSPLLFHGIPHVLYKGSLDTHGFRKIKV
ncbi:MAG TPA: group-specific protein [Candidatus Paceibacterota bacterium]|nr:group-specific protein [Candidatus Paceibacterota bacterium]